MKRIVIFLFLLILIIPSNINAASKYLYDVLKNAAEDGTYAREYSGEHHDSFVEEPSQKIYYWYGSNATNGSAILNKNNVIFANHCWQMIRTTDTGGVKMIYNGESEDGKCLNTRGTHVGYSSGLKNSMNTSYYYGTDYVYDSESKKFTLSGTITTGEVKIGQYTCSSRSADSTCAILYYIDSLSDEAGKYNVLSYKADSNYYQFGQLPFSSNAYSIGDAGYMYNTTYPYKTEFFSYNEQMFSSIELDTTYWYAQDIKWIPYKYNLVDPYQISNSSDYPSLTGKYTFQSSDISYTHLFVNYIVEVDDNFAYTILLDNVPGTTHTLDYYNYKYTFGDSYTDNGDGTYTINNPTTIERINWFANYSNVANKYVCKNAQNATCSELWYASNTDEYSMSYILMSDRYKFANGFTWDGNKYTLDNNETVIFGNLRDSEKIKKINSAHYTCLNLSGECTTLFYVHSISGNNFSYISLTNGKSIEDAINETLYDNVNNNDSLIKIGIDEWFDKYIIDYSDYLEDTIFCNDRSQSNASTNAWNPNGGDLKTKLRFSRKNDLSCANNTDKFSTLNVNAKLKYKVGLASYGEMNLLGNDKTRATGQNYWTITPLGYNGSAEAQYVSRDGLIPSNGNFSINMSLGVRPVVSLEPGTRYTSGTGSMEDPYMVDYTRYYNINVEVKNETKNLNINIEDLTSVPENGNVIFKLIPIDGYALESVQIIDDNDNEITFSETTNENEYTFTMPGANVTIIPSYKKNRFDINVKVENETKDIDINIESLTNVLVGENVVIKIRPITGYKLNSIKIYDANNNEVPIRKTSNENEYTFIMPESNITIVPNYEKVSNEVSVTENANTLEFVMEVNDVSAILYEDTVIFRITPKVGYKIDKIDIIDEENNKINYKPTSNENEYEFIMPATSVGITPYFSKVSNAVNVIENEHTLEFKIEVNDATAVIYEDSVKFTIVPEEGYEIDNIIILDENQNNVSYTSTGNENEYVFTMPVTSVTITPNYKKIEKPIEEIKNPKTGNTNFSVYMIILLIVGLLSLTYLLQRSKKFILK